MTRWDDESPVFFDFETQSAADLKAVGGRLYAADPTTRILSAVFWIDGTFHVWLPIPTHDPDVVKKVDTKHVWPHQLGPAQPVTLWCTGTPPTDVKAAARAGRTFVAHNCLGFDRFIWQHCVLGAWMKWTGACEPNWADTLPLARAGGCPGRLDALAQELVRQCKDAGGRIAKKYFTATVVDGELTYPQPGPGDLEVILRYNVADVDLLRRAWAALEHVPVEADVIDAHDAVNCRGVRVDTALAQKLVDVSKVSVNRAASRIAAMTGGVLNVGNLRSVPQVNAWLDSHGVRIRDYTGKRTLRKDFVTQALANPWTMLDEDAPAAAVADIKPEVFEVLRLRSAALRISGAKGEKAVIRAAGDGRARDVHTYWQAHTGRWSSAGIQVHNLPRPRKGVPIAELLAAHESGEWGHDAEAAYEMIAAKLPPKLTVDDAISSLLRPLFVPAEGFCLAPVDYAAIECRGVAWISDEEGLLHTLATGGDVYKTMAARIFGKPADAVTDTERQVGKVTVLGCGYSMSAEKFRLYCGLQGIDLAAAGTDAQACVEAFRGAYPRIAGTPQGAIDGKPYRTGGVWSQLARAAMSAVTVGGVHRAGKTAWGYNGSTLICTLPSGRQLRYRGARVEDRVPGYAVALGLDKLKPTLVYEGQFGEQTLYGGKITENVVQAICRDLLATAIVGAERAGLRPVLHVHDEIVCEVPLTDVEASLGRLADIMTEVPPWAAGFPIGVEGFASPRYQKSPPAGWPHVKRPAAVAAGKSEKTC